MLTFTTNVAAMPEAAYRWRGAGMLGLVDLGTKVNLVRSARFAVDGDGIAGIHDRFGARRTEVVNREQFVRQIVPSTKQAAPPRGVPR